MTEISNAYGKALELEGLLLLLQTEGTDNLKTDQIFNRVLEKIDEIRADVAEAYRICEAGNTLSREDIHDCNAPDRDSVEIAENVMFEEAEDAGEEYTGDSEEPKEETALEKESVHEYDTLPDDSATIAAADVSKEISAAEIEDEPCSDMAQEQTVPTEITHDEVNEVKIVVDETGIDINQSALASKVRGNIRKAFTLNDNYKFRRQLFFNSQDKYNEVLSQIESMKSTHEAENYIYDVLGYDRDNQDAKEFMSIVSAYFMGK